MAGDLKEKTQKKNTGLFIIVGLVVVIVLLVVVIVLLVGKRGEVTDESNQSVSEVSDQSTVEEPKRNVVVTRDTVEDIVDDMFEQEYVPPGYYSVSMNTEWHFATGDAVSEDAYVENLAENTNDVYFDVFLEDNEEEAIYESPVLPRGSELDEIALDTALPAGTHDCVMIYHLVDEDQNTISTLRIAFTIIVEE